MMRFENNTHHLDAKRLPCAVRNLLALNQCSLSSQCTYNIDRQTDIDTYAMRVEIRLESHELARSESAFPESQRAL